MPQLSFETFFTQAFWLIVVFLLTYLIIGSTFIPKISYIVKYRIEYQNERDWSLTILNNEIRNLTEITIFFTTAKNHFKNIFTKFDSVITEYLNIIKNFLKNHYQNTMQNYLIQKYTILVNLYSLTN
jgi:predicted PurR-regulated permease PerM